MPYRRLEAISTLLFALALGVVLPSQAAAVCTLSACDASALTANPQCCSAASCTIDGVLTASGPTCTFDFGTRNLVVSASGQVAAQGKTVTLKAKSMKLSGLLDVRGPGGADAGAITIVTTGGTALAYSQEGGTSAIIDASSSAGGGGRITIEADGMVSFAKGSVKADGGPAKAGGIIDVSTTAGDVSVLLPITASGGAAAPSGQLAAAISISAPGSLAIGGSGRLVADFGSIGVVTTGAASFAAGAVVQSNAGGDITMIAGSIESFGEFRSAGDFGAVDLTATDGPVYLSLLSQGITVGPGGSVSLTTDSAIPDGTLTVDMPILANGASVELVSAGDILVSKKIETTGILDSGAGSIELDAGGDVIVSKAIVGSDVYGIDGITIDALGSVTIAGNLELKGGLDTDGGEITITSGADVHLQGDIQLNVSGADTSNGGYIEITAAGGLAVGNAVALVADASPEGVAGSIDLAAGDDISPLPGDLTFAGDIKANGHAPANGNHVSFTGCAVQIPSGAVVDITGDVGSVITVTARKSLAVGGQLKASGANVLEFPVGGTVSLTGSFTPARSAGACTGGTVTANGCQRPVCAGAGVPSGCLFACPTCGDDVVEFPETCDGGAGGAFCAGNIHCSSQCRQQNCGDTSPCTTDSCNSATGCSHTNLPNGASCEDNTVCNGEQWCQTGLCVTKANTTPACGSDGNACTTDGCDPVTSCFHDPVPNGPGVPGCDDGNPCTGVEQCQAGTCMAGTLVNCTPPLVCNPSTALCEGPGACQTAAQCNDGNPCTDDVCNGVCSNPPVANGTSCDDGNLCNGLRVCTGGVCQAPSPPVNCNDNNPCTPNTCDPLTGVCDGPLPGCCTGSGQCGDGNPCTTDACTDNQCTHGVTICDDGLGCTADSCDPIGGCQHTPIPNCTSCTTVADCGDDADVCTDKACVGGGCQQVANPNCCQLNSDCTDIDSNPCTANGPCTSNRCEGPFPLTDTSCGTQCNPATCQSGTCVGGTSLECTDGDLCTSDVCIDGKGCTHPPIAFCCLAEGQCDDTNVCTEDSCDLDANRCVNDVVDETCTPCAGGDPFECGPRCTTRCAAGRCEDRPASVQCEDDNPCTVDACDPNTGCSHTPIVPDATCDDDDGCTDDSCDPATGCTHTGKASFDSVTCRLGKMRGALDGAAPDAFKSARVRTRFTKKVDKLVTKIEQARTSTKCSKTKRLLGGVRGQLRSYQRTLNRLAGKQVDADLATRLATLAGEAGARADETRNAVTCE